MGLNIKPLHDRVVIKRNEEERKSAGGIVIPDSATKEKPVEGQVLAVGPGKSLENGEIRALSVKPGDKVLFGKYAGTEVKLGDDEYTIMREDDILAIIG